MFKQWHTLMLDSLPDELLDRVASYLPSARPVACLSLVSRRLHDQVEKHGWRAFVRTRLSTSQAPWSRHWRDTANAYTALSRDWDRRAFRARYLEPSLYFIDASTGDRLKRWPRPRGQTMGLRPAIDCRETRDCQTLAWSAGSELLVRKQGQIVKQAAEICSSPDQRPKPSENVAWWSYRTPGAEEGRDDILTVNIASAEPSIAASADRIIIGSASGELACLEISASPAQSIVKARFATKGQAVQSASLSEGDGVSMLATHLSDNHITLFPLDLGNDQIQPLSRVQSSPASDKSCYVWSTRFLSRHRLALGSGPSRQPLQVFAVSSSGISEQPVRTFMMSEDPQEQTRNSVFALEPVSGHDLGSLDGDVFLSGGLDGVRLHDMRSARHVEQNYDDPTDDSAIYSLLSHGTHRVVAGASRESQVKIFDLRMRQPTDYNYLDASGDRETTEAASLRDPWKLYINPLPGSAFARQQQSGPRNWWARSARGSVYSLSSPHRWSPFIFAGVEQALVEFEFCSVLNTGHNLAKKDQKLRDRYGEINLPMYSMNAAATHGMLSWAQLGITDTFTLPRRRAGLDERWIRKT